MIALALALAYLGTLAAGCWAWWQVRTCPSLSARMADLQARAKVWDEAAGEIDTLRIAAGLKPKKP